MMVLYDSEAKQKIELTIDGAKVTHTLAPLSNKRFFQMQSEIERLGDAKPSELLTPKFSLWRELCKSRTAENGAGDIDGIEAAAVINLITAFQTIDGDQIGDTGAAFDESAAFLVTFLGVMGGVAVPLGLTFRSLEVSDLDRFYEIRKEANETRENLSKITESTAEKVYNFGFSMLTKAEGYKRKNFEKIPAWHVIGAIADIMNGYELQMKNPLFELAAFD